MNEIKGRIVLEDKTSSTIDKIINRVNKLGTAGAKVSNNLQKMFNGNFKIQEVSKQIDDVISKLEKQSASGFELNELGAKRYAEQLYKLTNQLNQLQGAGSSSLSDIDAQTQKVKEDTRSYRKEIEKVKAQFNGMVSNGFGDSFKNIFESIDNSSIKELEYLIKQLYGREISIDMSKPREEINKTIKELLNFSALLGSLGNPEKYNSLIENQFKKLGTEVNKATAAMEKFGNAAKSAEDKTGKALEKINKSIGKFFKTYVIMRLISTTMSAFGKYFSEAHKALLDMDAASGGLIGYNIQLSAINSALQRLAAQIVVCGANFLNAFGPAIVFVINLVNKLIEGINMLFAALGGKNSYLVAKDNYFKDYAAGLKDTDENAQGANGSLKKLYTLISGFDELNTLSAQNGVADSIKSAAGGLSNIKWDDLFEEKPLQGFWKWLSEVVQKIKEFLAQVPSWVKWLGAVAAAIAALITWFKLKNKTLNIQNGLEHLATKGLELMWLVVGTGIALLPGLISKLKDLVKGLKDTGKATDDNLGEENQGAWNNWGWVANGALAGVCAALSLFGLNLADNFLTQSEWATNSQLTWDGWKLGVLGIITAFITSGAALFNDFKLGIQGIVDNLFSGLNLSFDGGMFSLKTILTTGLGLMLGTITGWGTTSVFNFNAIIDALTKNWGLGLDNLSQNWSQMWNKISEIANDFGEGISNWAGDLGSNIANGVINGVNGAIGALNGLVQAYKRAKAEDESNMQAAYKRHQAAVAKMGLAAVGAFVWKALAPLALPALKTFIPMLAFANGGVIDSPTYGLMGEYPGAKHNPEIVAPQSILQETMDSSNAKYVALLDKKLNMLIEAVNNVDMEVSIGDDVIAKSAARGNKAYKKRTGNNLLMV